MKINFKKNAKVFGLVLILLGAAAIAIIINKNLYATPGPNRQLDKWILVMEDNFDGNTLNETIWSRGYPPSSHNCEGQCHNNRAWYAPENVIVENGLLKIKGENKTHPNAPSNHSWEGKSMPLNFTSGAINSRGKFEFKYGYIEARQKMPQGPTGFWPAFWTIQSGYRSYGEIDIIEWLSGENNQFHTALHTGAEGYEKLISKGEKHRGLPDLTQDFHIYGVEWMPDRISFYFDNVEVRRITDRAQINILEKQHIRINLAIGGWASDPDENTIWPAWYETDWVRVYQYIDYLN